ncbi:MAG: T9SS type A sorting domain-containing protein [Flavobacteriales bacterium]|nr:T9SS type A sorting domain-containing protein [Flavobacteriales bacterium]MBK9701732.1 T9SS type A sorting domain-containing protein [Flavobacteriales bacterium]
MNHFCPASALTIAFCFVSTFTHGQWMSGVDPDFGNGGLHTWDHGGNTSSHAMKVFRRSDGKTVVAGINIDAFNQITGPFTTLLDPDGQLAADYGRHGTCDYKDFLYYGYWYRNFFGAAMQSDGKVLMLLYDQNSGSEQLVRVQADGSPDLSFGPYGAQAITGGNFSILAVQPDDGILLVGSDGNGDPCVRRLLPSGAVDTSFGTGGAFVTSAPVSFREVEPLANGQILVGGTGLGRLNADGTLDTSFGTNGWSTLPFLNNAPYMNDLAVQPNGMLLVCNDNTIERVLADGTALDPNFNYNFSLGAFRLEAASDGSWYSYYTAIRRYDANDQFDTSFGPFGELFLDPGTTTDFAYYDGSGIDVVGHIDRAAPNHDDVVVMRCDPFGDPMNNWGQDGRMEFNGNGGGENVSSMAVSNDGHIWTVGPGYQAPPMMARFLPDGSTDTGFGYNGAAYPPVTLSCCIGARSDGRAVVGGSALAGLSAVAVATLVESDGSYSPSWGGGISVTGTVNSDQRCADLLALPDDRTAMLINMSYINDPNGWNSAVVMLDANGELDPAFGNGGQVITGIGGPTYMSGMARLPGGGFLCTGTHWNNGVSELFAYALDITGQPLSGFGTNGVSTIAVQPGIAWSTSGRPIVRPDGSFYVLYSNGGLSWISRMLADGTLDLSFANGSYVIDPNWLGTGMGWLSTGDLLVSGFTYDGQLPILKLDPSGAPVTSFGSNGVYTIADTANVHFGNSLVTVLPGDSVLIAGDLRNMTYWDSLGIDAFLFRFDPDFNVVQPDVTVGERVRCVPNPSNGRFVMLVSGAFGPTAITVRDLSGREVPVQVEWLGDQLGVELPATASNGLYMLTVRMPDRVVTEKVLLER